MEKIKIAVFALVLGLSLLAAAGTAWADDATEGVSWETVPTLGY